MEDLAYERLLRRLQAKKRSKYTVYCIFISRFGTIYGILFSLSDFAGNITELEDVFSQFEVGCKLVENLTDLLAKFSTSILGRALLPLFWDGAAKLESMISRVLNELTIENSKNIKTPTPEPYCAIRERHSRNLRRCGTQKRCYSDVRRTARRPGCGCSAA